MPPLALLKHSLTTNYFNFTSRSGRREYAFLSLVVWLFPVVMVGLGSLLFPNLPDEGRPSTQPEKAFLGLGMLTLLALLPPTLAVNVRRLHDLGRGEALYVVVIALSFIPLLGALLQLLFTIFLALAPGQPASNRWGPPPLER